MARLTTTLGAGTAHGASTAGGKPWRQPAILAISASLALALGAVVYLTDRDASRAMLIPATAAFAGGKVFGVLGQWLPSFVHAFAFSLFTAAVLAPRSAPRYGACLAWGAINVAFEVGQHPLVSASLADALQGPLGAMPMAQALARYFVQGTFDRGDIVAALSGALAAGALLHFMHRGQENRHAQ